MRHSTKILIMLARSLFHFFVWHKTFVNLSPTWQIIKIVWNSDLSPNLLWLFSLKLETLVHAAGSRVYSYIQLRRPRRPGKKLMSPCGSQSLSTDGNKIGAEIVRQPRVWRKFIAHIIEFPSVTIHPNCGCTGFPSISVQQSDRPRWIDWRKCHQIVFVTKLSSGGLWAHICALV